MKHKIWRGLTTLALALVLAVGLAPHLTLKAEAISANNGFDVRVNAGHYLSNNNWHDHYVYSTGTSITVTNNNGTLTISGTLRYENHSQDILTNSFSVNISGFSCETNYTTANALHVHETSRKDVLLPDGTWLDIFVLRSAGHTVSSWTSNGDGTHSGTCAVCNSVITKTCSGGTATCVAPATCSTCKSTYGSVNPNNHSWGDWKSNGNGTHTRTCKNNCGKQESGNCSGGTATCVTLATCSTCKSTYGSVNPNNHSWGDWKSNGNDTHSRVCAWNGNHTQNDNCSGGTATCVAPAACSTCKSTYGSVNLNNHSWGDWKSNGNDTHSRVCAWNGDHTQNDNCSGGTATCTEQAVCGTCSTAYGALNPDNHAYSTWDSDGTNHWQVCSRDNTHTTSPENCAVGANGTAATCVAKAVCGTCGQKFGEPMRHEYVYTSGEGKILEHCKGVCNHEATATLTANAEYTYTGFDVKPVTVAYSEGWEGGELIPTYTGDTRNVTDAGATATITKENASATASYQITKAPLTIAAEQKDVPYLGPVPEYTVTYSGFKGSDDEEVLEGTLEFSCAYTPGTPVSEPCVITPSGMTAQNYEITYENNVVLIMPIDGEAQVEITGWIYGQYDETVNAPVASTTTNLSSDGTPKPVTFTYAEKGTETFTATRPTKAGEYTVKAAFGASTNYNAVEATADFTITPAETTVTAVLADTDKTFVYSGSAHTPVPTVTRDAGVEYELVYADNVNAGTATVTVRAKGNYTFEDIVLPFTITKAIPTAEMFMFSAPMNLTYDGTEKQPAIQPVPAVNPNGMGGLNYRFYDAAGKEVQPIDAGTYTVKLDVAEGANYTAASGLTQEDWTFTIEKAAVTPTVSTEEEPVYNGKAHTPAVTVKVGNTVLNPEDYTVSYSNNVNAGDAATMTVSPSENSNYTFEPAEGNFTIKPATVTLIADSYTLEKGNFGMPVLTYTPVGFLGEDKMLTEPTLTCAAILDKVGDYEIRISGGTVSDNYTLAYQNGMLYVRLAFEVELKVGRGGSASVDFEKALEGMPVTIQVTPKKGYKLKSLTVTDAAGKACEVSQDEDGNYVFSMPNSKATVTVKFKSKYTSIPDSSNPKTADSILPAMAMLPASLIALAFVLEQKKRRQ